MTTRCLISDGVAHATTSQTGISNALGIIPLNVRCSVNIEIKQSETIRNSQMKMDLQPHLRLSSC